MTDEEYVRAHWERAELCPLPFSNRFNTSLGGLRFTRSNPGEEDTPELAWAAAAAFTSEHLEQIRQLQAERDWMAGEFGKRECLEHVECIRRRAIQARILARIESALADLKRGMK